MNTAMPPSYRLIDGFDTMTKQQLLDLSCAHLLSTGKPGVSETNASCAYAGSGCAAAPFIKEEFRAAADSFGAWGDVSFREGYSRHEEHFIAALQRAHDDAWSDAKEAIEYPETRVRYWRKYWARHIVMICLATGLEAPKASGFY